MSLMAPLFIPRTIMMASAYVGAQSSMQGVGVGWLGQNAPGTWAYDLSEAHLWCHWAPPQPPDATQAGQQNGVAGAVCPRGAAGH